VKDTEYLHAYQKPQHRDGEHHEGAAAPSPRPKILANHLSIHSFLALLPYSHYTTLPRWAGRTLTFPRIGLKDSSYSELVVNDDLVVVELTNPQLRQLAIARRRTSLKEEELIHTPPSQYPHTRTWARLLHDSLPALQGLCWRPRLGGAGLAYMLFGDRCAPGALTVTSGPTDIDSGGGFVKVFAIAQSANIKIIG
jgi:hypothetical protein